MIAPAGVILPILLALDSVNQRLPSGPAAMPSGPLRSVGTEYWVIVPEGVILPILLALGSVNQRLPSGPAAIMKEPAAVLKKNSEAHPAGAAIAAAVVSAALERTAPPTVA